MPPSVVLQFRCKLPVSVLLGNVSWEIAIDYYDKGHRAEIAAKSSTGRRGEFISGRARLVERALSTGVSVPVGTIRHRLALELASRGLAEISA